MCLVPLSIIPLVQIFGAKDRRLFNWPTDALKAKFPALKRLTQQQAELLHLNKADHFPDSEFRVLDLSQTLRFCKVTCGRMPCVTPSGQKFLTKQVRWLSGAEALRFQGMFFDLSKLSKYKSTFLTDLAGNAFELTCAAGHLFSTVAFLAVNHCAQKTASPTLQAPSILFEPDFENDAES
jgi:hypothetical protein